MVKLNAKYKSGEWFSQLSAEVTVDLETRHKLTMPIFSRCCRLELTFHSTTSGFRGAAVWLKQCLLSALGELRKSIWSNKKQGRQSFRFFVWKSAPPSKNPRSAPALYHLSSAKKQSAIWHEDRGVRNNYFETSNFCWLALVSSDSS